MHHKYLYERIRFTFVLSSSFIYTGLLVVQAVPLRPPLLLSIPAPPVRAGEHTLNNHLMEIHKLKQAHCSTQLGQRRAWLVLVLPLALWGNDDEGDDYYGRQFDEKKASAAAGATIKYDPKS